MIVLVDVELAEATSERPAPGTAVVVDLLDTSFADADAVVLASNAGSVQGVASDWLTTIELVADPVDPRADLTVWARVAGSGEPETASGDWITMQHVPVATDVDSQRVTAPVRRVG